MTFASIYPLYLANLDKLAEEIAKGKKIEERILTLSDLVGFDKTTGEYLFYDCSAESPKGRRSICYDRAALESKKEFKPENSALEMASKWELNF
jgi:hypothetical protein